MSSTSRCFLCPRARSPFLRFFHLSALTSCFLKNNECNFFVFSVVISFLSLTWTQIFASARHFVHDTVLRFALSAASAFLFFARLSFAAAAVVAVFLIFLRHSGTSPSMVRFLSRPPPFPLTSSIFVSSYCCFYCFSCMMENRRRHS